MPDSTRSVAKPPSPSAEVYDRLRQLEMSAQQDTSDLKNHKDGCVEGQKRVEGRFDDVDERFDKIDLRFDKVETTLTVISNAQIANAAIASAAVANGRPKWWSQLLGAAVIGLIGWMGATIFNMQTAAIKEAQDSRRPAAQVTVNPTAPGVPGQTYQVQPQAAPPAPDAPPS